MKELSKITVKEISNDKELKQATQNLVALKILKEEAEKSMKKSVASIEKCWKS